MQFPQTKYRHRCKPTHCGHSPGFFWHNLRLVLATIRLSEQISWPPALFFLPSWMANLPSSKRTFRRTDSATVKFCAMVLSRRSKSRQPWLSHRVLMMNLEITEVILKRSPTQTSEPHWACDATNLRETATPVYRETKLNVCGGATQWKSWSFH